MAKGQEPSGPDERAMARKKDRPTIGPRDAGALTVALLFVALGFAGIYFVAKTADVKDGTVLVALLIVPAVLFLVLSGRVSNLKGPGGLELRLSEVANQAIPLADDQDDSTTLSFEQIRAVERGRRESFVARTRDISPQDPVVLTLTLGSGPIDGAAAAEYAKGLTQFSRFRFVAILDSHAKLISYMDQNAFRHIIEAEVTDSQQLLNDIEHQDVGAVRAYPGMIVDTVTPRTSVAGALRKLEQDRLDALLVTEEGNIVGVAERDHLASVLLLTLIDHVSGQA